MATNHKPADKLLTITRRWQIAFISTAVVFWLIIYIYAGLGFLYHPGYYSAGTNAIQISYALYPATFFIITLLLLPHFKDWLKKLFMAILITLMGMMVWMVASTIVNRLWPNLMYWNINGRSTWDTFGGQWIQMIIAWLLFATFIFSL